MDKLDQALYRLGDQRARQAELFKRKEQVLSIARAGKAAKRGRRVWAYAATAAALMIGLVLGVFAERAELLPPPRDEPRYMGIPKTDGDGEPMPPAQMPERWYGLSAEDMRLKNAPSSADIAKMRFSYLPDGMTPATDAASGLIEVIDEARTRSVLAKPCLMYELNTEEYAGLKKGFARPRVRQGEAGGPGRIAWTLRLNDDVYLYVSIEGLTYEESVLFIQGIQRNAEGR